MKKIYECEWFFHGWNYPLFSINIKQSTCMLCDFFKLVKKEIGSGTYRLMKPRQ